MAKKKAVSSNSKKSTGNKNSKSAARPKRSTKPRATKAAANKAAVSDEQIGRAAGEIWQALNQNGSQTITALKKSLDAPGDVVPLAIGWLAREGKLEFSTSGRSVMISLR